MNKTTITIAVLAAGALSLACLYFLFSNSNYFLIGGGQVSKTKLGSGQEDTNGELQIEDKNKIILAAVGDIMLSRDVERKMITKKDWKYPFEETADITSGADLAFGNLETTILKGNIIPSEALTFRTDPKAVEGLKFAGFDVLSLANNHMMNFGHDGIQSTVQNLDAAGIDHAGAGLSEDGIYKPVIKTVKSVKFGFLAYSYSNEQSTDKNKNIYGVAKMDTELIKSQVADLRKSVDVVVVSMHAGTEYSVEPASAQTNFAHAAIDAGADLVIGHHPHVVETFEKYNNGYIIYSLGNFVFDQMWSDETKLGAIAQITFDKNKISKIDFVPVKIFDYAQPRLAEGADKDKILERLKITYN
jgi:poly-gamma-glutamate synthesis protein (capsule biosynthesis protein)